MYDVNTNDVRHFFADVWRKRQQPQLLDALQQKALRIIAVHSEYAPYLENIEQYLTRVWQQYAGDWVKAEHDMIEVLAETLWQAQRYGQGLDVNDYMTRLRSLVGLGQEDEARLNPHEVGKISDIQA